MEFDPDVLRYFDAMKALNLPPLSSLSPADARALYREGGRRNGGPRVEMAAVRDLAAPGPGGPIPLRLYRPEGVAERGAPALVFIHGGGWVIGDLDSHDGVCRRIAQDANCLVVAVDYRLAPEHPAPAAAEDVTAALRWIAAHADEIGADPARLAVGGDSAGGNLSAVATVAAREMVVPLRCQILIYPSVDNRAAPPAYPSRDANRDVPPLTPDVLAWFTRQYLPEPRLRDDWRQSPIVVPDKAGLPPALVIVAGRDPLHSEGLAYADALEAAGVPVERLDVPGMIHGFITMGGIMAAADKAFDAIAAELRERFAQA
jgi:acetyl esterase